MPVTKIDGQYVTGLAPEALSADYTKKGLGLKRLTAHFGAMPKSALDSIPSSRKLVRDPATGLPIDVAAQNVTVLYRPGGLLYNRPNP